ncbi:uncharacterized protein LOC131597842 [Vicia villosa]|uniref:uncharacterized protein LOC131597842 n=1 Tax=Vicia villosa TaxID=3911 RepID=UPI00273AF276|nr:uncharacterized protein LOC131597842 [Vicia villosa]
MEDFNNVITSQGRIGGNSVTVVEHRDLVHMMNISGLYEADTRGGNFTWSKNRRNDVIYSRIDHMLGNMDWFQKYSEAVLEILAPNIFDHAPIRIRTDQQTSQRRYMFKFLNCITQDPSYTQVVQESWKNRIHGTVMHIFWSKLRRLHPTLKPLIKKSTNIQIQIQQAGHELMQAQEHLTNDLFDVQAKEQVKIFQDKITQLNQNEERMLMQKSKVTWLQLGDSNNAYFHALVKEKNRQKDIYSLIALDGRILSTHDQIEDEILDFYTTLVGNKATELKGIDITAIRRGKLFP